jgi:hypothetical protein
MRLVLVLFIVTTFQLNAQEIIALGNYHAVCFDDTTIQKVDSLPSSLEHVSTILLFSGSTSNFKQSDILRLENFVKKGGGLYAGADNWPLQAHSNQMTYQIYKKESFGNYEERSAALNESGNLDLEQIDTIPAGQTTSAFPMDYRLKVEAWVSDQPLILSGEIEQGRIIIDGGYSRFYCIHRNETTDELLRKILGYLRKE